MMLGSWMGSHFTKVDLVNESRLIDYQNIVISFEGDRDGEARSSRELLGPRIRAPPS